VSKGAKNACGVEKSLGDILHPIIHLGCIWGQGQHLYVHLVVAFRNDRGAGADQEQSAGVRWDAPEEPAQLCCAVCDCK